MTVEGLRFPRGVTVALGRRLSVSFSDPAWAWLEAEAKRLGLPLAEVLRRIVDRAREGR